MAPRHAVLGIDNGSFYYATTPVFRDVSFLLDGERTGLVGENGAGKSTLLRCLAGELELDKGEITRSKGAHIGFVPQETPDGDLDLTVRALLERSLRRVGSCDDWRIDIVLDELNLPVEDAERRLGDLSGGWQRLLLIAAATALEDPDIVILDEPTNHLDIAHLNKLEDWLLNRTNAPMLIVSHDRDFLDQVTTRTIFLRADGAHAFKSTFAIAREELLRRDAAHARRRALESKEIERLERMVQRYKQWGVLNSDFHRKQKSTQKRIARIEDQRTQTYTPRERELKLHDAGMEAKVALRIDNFVVTAPASARPLYKIDKLHIRPGDRIALLGANGTGKSTLLGALERAFETADEHYGSKSPIRFNPGVRLVHFDQRMRLLDLTATPLSYISQGGLIERPRAIALLANAGFAYKRAENAIGELSFGERSRLIFLRMRLAKPNFYLLDEPTNHLDIEGQEDLEDQLDEAEVACVFVSHDRYFTRTAATRFLQIYKGRLVEIESADAFFDAQ